MAKERLKSPRARLFVALDLPEEIREGLARWQKTGLGDPALRPMRPEALHVTLCFLSYHPEKAIPRIGEIVVATAPGPVGMRFEPDPVPIPGGRPRLFSIRAESEAAIDLQAKLSDALEREGFYKPEKRPFSPHVTVARVRSERRPPEPGQRRGKGRPKRLSEPPGRLPRALTKPFGAVRVALYRSHLKPTGAEYESLAGVDLPFPDGDRRGDPENGR